MTSLMRIESHQRSTIVLMIIIYTMNALLMFECLERRCDGRGQRGKHKDYWPCGSKDVVVVVPHDHM